MPVWPCCVEVQLARAPAQLWPMCPHRPDKLVGWLDPLVWQGDLCCMSKIHKETSPKIRLKIGLPSI